MQKHSAASDDTPMSSLQLALLLEQKQRLLGENSDALRRCENTIRECREELDEGRDHSHFRWLAPSVVLLLVGSLLMGVSLPLALVCCAVGVILAVRWLSGLIHCNNRCLHLAGIQLGIKFR